ncbi:MAG: transposase [Nitrospira sp.]|nr:transposase [Nitrospira sp.]
MDDRRVISGIDQYGLQWKDAPTAYDPHKMLSNRFVHWSQAGVFKKIFHE